MRVQHWAIACHSHDHVGLTFHGCLEISAQDVVLGSTHDQDLASPSFLGDGVVGFSLRDRTTDDVDSLDGTASLQHVAQHSFPPKIDQDFTWQT
jgi:hypothetical protein